MEVHGRHAGVVGAGEQLAADHRLGDLVVRLRVVEVGDVAVAGPHRTQRPRRDDCRAFEHHDVFRQEHERIGDPHLRGVALGHQVDVEVRAASHQQVRTAVPHPVHAGEEVFDQLDPRRVDPMVGAVGTHRILVAGTVWTEG
ncbi:MAG: hypothetical protein H6837_13060 [Planctomycetes bacterium]|nr:hypothetical protein [Planctomycetota bacterium]